MIRSRVIGGKSDRGKSGGSNSGMGKSDRGQE